ncbi:hypothetical protein LTR56_011538 [Elasticomyces elasticus]|nr:hypothetical protein LTR56_011538 [Elasticomyces elasticus]KAK3643267.1 hypothetical protein LTR22_015734 [Elasticomyces elasticus]KAK5763174.1 hypothetical protein LTS12_006763 [Elasticomyces elasticus]
MASCNLTGCVFDASLCVTNGTSYICNFTTPISHARIFQHTGACYHDPGLRVAMLTLILLLNLPILFFITTAMARIEREYLVRTKQYNPKYEEIRYNGWNVIKMLRSMRRCHPTVDAVLGTVSMLGVAVCMAMYARSVHREFKCGNVNLWTSEWIFTALVPGLLSLTAMGNWTHLLVLLYAVSRTEVPPTITRTWKAPLGIYLLLAPAIATLAAALLIGTLPCAVIYAVFTGQPRYLVDGFPREILQAVRGEGKAADYGMLSMTGVQGVEKDFGSEESAVMSSKRRDETTLEWF